MLRTLEQAIEEGRASLDLDAPPSPLRLTERPSEEIAESSKPLGEFPEASRPAPANQAEPAAPTSVHGIQLVKRAQPEPTNQREEIPLPLAEIASQLDWVAEPKAEQKEAPPVVASGMNGNGTSYEAANPAPEKAVRVSLPRLSDLRGMRFSQAIRELDHARRPALPSAGIEMLMSAIAPFEPMFTRMEPAPAKNDELPEAAPGEFDLPDSLRALIPISESGDSREANGEIPAEGNAANGDPVHTNSFPPKTAEQAQSKGRRGEESERARPEQKVARQKLSGPFEQLQILPSRRGQYKKKG
jgi:hypothetical protein